MFFRGAWDFLNSGVWDFLVSFLAESRVWELLRVGPSPVGAEAESGRFSTEAVEVINGDLVS